MKTGTITFHAPNNNGSFLQAYALQKILLDKLGVDNEIIDFRSEKQTNQYKTFRPIHSRNDLFKNIIALPHYKSLNHRYEKFENMRNKFLRKTRCFVLEDDAINQANNYDVVIAGSDQIWNTGAPDFSKVYFLPNLKTKKVSYAVSCGSIANSTALEKYRNEINNFDMISVRESTIKNKLSAIYNGSIQIVLDPTLLLQKEDYCELYSKKALINKDYIFYYSINFTKDSLKSVRTLSKKTGLPVYTIFTSFHTSICKQYGIKIIYDGGPSEFLNLIANAKIVATNSFHGTAFSLIFNKNLYYLCDIVNGNLKNDDRIGGLFQQLGLDNRNYNYTHNSLLPDIEFSKVDAKIQELKLNSIDWLKQAIQK